MNLIELLSIALVTVVALTAVAGAGVLTVAGATSPPVVTVSATQNGNGVDMTHPAVTGAPVTFRIEITNPNVEGVIRTELQFSGNFAGLSEPPFDTVSDIITDHGATSVYEYTRTPGYGEVGVVRLDIIGDWNCEQVRPFDYGSFFIQYSVKTIASDTTPPVISTGGPYVGSAGALIVFDGSASDAGSGLKSVTWDFGDGQTGQGPDTTHTYATAGTYEATLTAVDNEGNTASEKTTVTVNPTQASVQQEISDLQKASIALQNPNTHKAFDNKLGEVSTLVDMGTAESYALAMDKLTADLMPKTDGKGSPPDWVTSADQAAVLGQLQAIYDHIAWLAEQQT